MRKFIFILTIVAALGISNDLMSQSYKSAIGARLGYPFSASYKTFLNETNAVELNLGFRPFVFGSWISGAAAYQIHKDIPSVAGLRWYYGGGGIVSFYTYNSSYLDDAGGIGFGIQGYLGLDYVFADIPLNVSVDWVPTFFIGNGYYTGFGAGYGALSARYILNR
ncbi:MAG: hypothetical protein WAT92_22755 [Saprospiraceae bacterium]|nr:hypothetical protein [Saprospiraceae bacterium]